MCVSYVVESVCLCVLGMSAKKSHLIARLLFGHNIELENLSKCLFRLRFVFDSLVDVILFIHSQLHTQMPWNDDDG